MAERRTREIKIEGAKGNRDAGKTFVITEMSAIQGEKWAARALLLIGNTGLDLPAGMFDGGFQGKWALLAAIGVRHLFMVDFRDAEPLLDEMMSCVRIKEDKALRDLTPDDIEEIATVTRLRMEAMDLHAGFSLAEKIRELTSALSASQDTSTT